MKISRNSIYFMRRVRRLLATTATVMGAVLVGCATSPTSELLADYGAWSTSWSQVGVCAGYGCAIYYKTGLTRAEAARIQGAFGPPAATAREERRAIQRAIAEIELIIGPKTHTANDEPGAALLNFDRRQQMDCIDESFNTTTYLRLLAGEGLLRFHRAGDPLRRGYFLNRWPHNTATIVDVADGVRYAVDSWFHGNGVPPEVVRAEQWLDGWHPKTSLPARVTSALSAAQ